MAMRAVVPRSGISRFMDRICPSSASTLRYFSDDKGRVLREEERAKETVYIQKMERERMEKKKKKMNAEQEKEKAQGEKADKAGGEAQKS